VRRLYGALIRIDYATPTSAVDSATPWSMSTAACHAQGSPLHIQHRSGARQQLCLRSWLRFYNNNSPTSTAVTHRSLRPRLRHNGYTSAASTPVRARTSYSWVHLARGLAIAHLPSSTLSASTSTMPHLIKAKCSSIKSQFLFFTFATPDTQGLGYATNFTGH
jgi:hypothetical protein